MDEFTLWNKYRINKRGILYLLPQDKPYKWKRGQYYKLLNHKNHGVILLHRAIAKKYLPNYTEDCVVHHLDGDVHNNHYANLYCCKNQKEHKRFHFEAKKKQDRIVWSTPDGKIPADFLKHWKMTQVGENVIFS